MNAVGAVVDAVNPANGGRSRCKQAASLPGPDFNPHLHVLASHGHRNLPLEDASGTHAQPQGDGGEGSCTSL